MLKKLIYYTLSLCIFSNALMCMAMDDKESLSKHHPIRYVDKTPEDLFFLAKQFEVAAIESYTENPDEEANSRLAKHKISIEDYSLTGDLIPHIINTVTRPALGASLKILDLTLPEDTILYLGRSPSILHITSRYLAPKINRSSDQHIQLNYSGSANIPNSRNIEINELRSVVTENRLLHFCQYLDAKGLDKLTADRNLYIVDQVGKGGGMNAFLRILIHYYTKYKNLETTPNVTLLLMNFNEENIHKEMGYYIYIPQSTTFMFCGSNDQNKGFRSLIVKAKALGMPDGKGGVLDAMDDEIVQQYLLPARSYPAYRWTAEYDTYRDSIPELAPAFINALLQACDIVLDKRRSDI